MKKHLLILFALVSATLVSQAQAGKNPQPDSIIKVIPIVRGAYGMYDSYNVPYGYTGASLYTIGGKLVSEQDVAFRLQNYGPSAAEYNAVRKNMSTAYVLYGGATVASIAAVVAFIDGTKTVPITINSGFGYSVQGTTYQHNYTAGAILTGVSLGLVAAAIITLMHAPKHLSKSVWLYNLRFQ